MATILDTAKYILCKCGQMSTMKLQKLCYYSQAWSIAWTEAPLFAESFEAWTNGPVAPVLFREHRGMYSISASDLGGGDENNLDAGQKDTIDRVLAFYGDWEPYRLREQTHWEAPWKTARAGVPDGEPCSNIITQESMGAYYGSL